ncbi:Hypothetical predicted protein, partial [Marmota monax]
SGRVAAQVGWLHGAFTGVVDLRYGKSAPGEPKCTDPTPCYSGIPLQKGAPHSTAAPSSNLNLPIPTCHEEMEVGQT